MRLPKGRKNVLVIPDTQNPFHHRDTIKFLKSVVNDYGPFDEVVHVGDEADFHALSDYPKDPNGYSAGNEYLRCVDSLSPLYELFPKVKVCVSNHTSRPFRKAFQAGLPVNMLKTYQQLLRAPKGWKWEDSWMIDGVVYEHGHNAPGGQNAALKAAIKNRASTVIGHHHSAAGIQFHANSQDMVFGMNVGCLIDHNTYAFAYGKNSKNKPILGCGVVMCGVPHFIPMRIDSRGRFKG